MVVNTGRAASRAFYLTLRGQPGVVAFNRYVLDKAVRMYIKRNLTAPLRKLVDGYDAFRTVRGEDAQLALVFHAARRRFNVPYDDPRNEKVLRVLRDQLGLKTVFFPVRDPKKLVLSELNRHLSGQVGDWRFAHRKGNWRESFTLAELAAVREAPPARVDFEPETATVSMDDMLGMARDFSAKTGKIHSLFRMFHKVFGDDVHYIDELFVTRKGLVLLSHTLLDGDRTYEYKQGPKRRLNKISNHVTDPPDGWHPPSG